ncbi:MAG: flavin reductase [Clostridia bacterium]|nr:flavin reductase [Clostridia bacterium]
MKDLNTLVKKANPLTDSTALFQLGYGLYAVTCRENGKDNAMIANTVSQIGSNPDLLAVSINRANFSAGIIRRTGKLNVSVLTESAPFSLFQRFGFQSGKNTDKMAGLRYGRSENNLPYLTEHSNAYFSLKVEEVVETPSHLLFLCTVEESVNLSKEKSVTYAYYHASIKPKKPQSTEKKGWVCKICGYVHEGDDLPADYICPICKHPASDFEKL